MEVVIVSLEKRGPWHCARDCGVAFVVHVTPGSAGAGAIAGHRVWLVLKTHSCHLVNRRKT